jgi:hypothetical protein
MFQQCAESAHFRQHHRIADFLSKAILFVCGDVTVAEFIQWDSARFSPSFEMHTARVIPEGSDFLDGHGLKNLGHLGR